LYFYGSKPLTMLQKADEIFPYISTIFPVCILVYFYFTGKKALEIFPAINTVTVVYRNRFASGYATKRSFWKNGRANNALDVVVTDEELWLKSMVLFAGLLQKFGILQKLPLKNITNATLQGDKVIVDFKNDAFEDAQVVIITKNPGVFLRALGTKTTR
jgi:hypothetical protein